MPCALPDVSSTPVANTEVFVHDVPSYDSLLVLLGFPPKTKPAVLVPLAAPWYLPVFKFPPVVQLAPLYSSVASVSD